MAVVRREAERQQDSTAAGEKSSLSPEDESAEANQPEELPVAAQMDTWTRQSF